MSKSKFEMVKHFSECKAVLVKLNSGDRPKELCDFALSWLSNWLDTVGAKRGEMHSSHNWSVIIFMMLFWGGLEKYLKIFKMHLISPPVRLFLLNPNSPNPKVFSWGWFEKEKAQQILILWEDLTSNFLKRLNHQLID